MDEEVFNRSVRVFLKQVGISSQRVMEEAVRQAVETGRLQGTEDLQATLTLRIPELGLEHVVEAELTLE